MWVSKRLNRYYHESELANKSAIPINQALSKHAHENLTLEILEYCLKDELLIREN